MNELAILNSAPIAAPQCNDNERLISLWLHGRPETTVRAYRRDVDALLAHVGGIPLAAVTLADLQSWIDDLGGADSSRARALAAVRSLFRFGERAGLLPVNVTVVLQPIRGRDTLADRIISVKEMRRVLRAGANARETAMLAMLYEVGLRRSELRGLRWQDATEADRGGAHLTVFGKGAKTRVIVVSRETWSLVAPLRGGAPIDAPIFAGRSGGPMDPSAIWRVVRRSAQRAGCERAVSPHWLRHGHASHALDAGAPIALVRDTLGHSSVAVTDRYLHARPNESSGKYLKR